ncbi:MAG: cysteine desulfurase, partial [Micavibrio aeruginosavorus]|nr:cysteine desulfurase [Micavibrio aeruginosavorus]
KVADFIGAASEKEIVFTRNATESINLVAQSWGRSKLKAGDEIILSGMEHHANIVPWQLLRDQIGIVLKIIPVREDFTLDMSAFRQLLSKKTRFVSVVHVSNALGTINPVAEIVAAARAYDPGIKILIDGSQAVVHGAVNVSALGADFYVFTGHKLYGPTGAGVLYGRYDVLQSMPPYQGGGDMIERVSFEKTAREQELLSYALSRMAEVPGVTLYGPQENRAGIISFTAEWGHTGDIAMILDQCGIAVRSGHHCCMPLMRQMGVDATLRASLGLYSNEADIDALISGLMKARELLGA